MFDLIKIYPVCEWVGQGSQVGVVVSLLPLRLRLYRLCSVTVQAGGEVVWWCCGAVITSHVSFRSETTETGWWPDKAKLYKYYCNINININIITNQYNNPILTVQSTKYLQARVAAGFTDGEVGTIYLYFCLELKIPHWQTWSRLLIDRATVQ